MSADGGRNKLYHLIESQVAIAPGVDREKLGIRTDCSDQAGNAELHSN